MQVTFPFPDEDMRERIWRVHLPDKLPRAEPLDLVALPRRYRESTIQEQVGGKVVDWMEQVSDEQYLCGQRRAQFAPIGRAIPGCSVSVGDQRFAAIHALQLATRL